MFGWMRREEHYRQLSDRTDAMAQLVDEMQASRDQWRELALEALADLRELRKAALAQPGEDAVPGVDPKTTREADAERARSLRERQDEEAA